MKKYRLKPEAVQFFQEKYATAIHTQDTWESVGIDVKALDEVQEAFLTYGHVSERNDVKSSSLCGWDKEGSHFHFTINFPSVKWMEHDKFTKGKVVRELMNRIQRNVDSFYSDFVNETKDIEA